MARMNFGPIMTFVALVAMVLVLAYAMKNPNFKNMLTGLLNKFKGAAVPTPTPVPQQPAPAPSSGAGPITPSTLLEDQEEAAETGPGARSQDPVTRAINNCAGTTGQTYLDCVNAAYPKANRARIGIA